MKSALLYRKLATLIDDVPLSDRLEDLAFSGVPRATFSAWCARVGARDLLSRPTRWASPR
jgi:DNA polymerase I